jgi:uncharacterized protein YkwD
MKRTGTMHLSACLIALLVVATSRADEPTAADIKPDPETLRSLETKINEMRESYGLKKLTVVADLSKKAQQHANWMKENGLIHSSMGYPEIIARGQKTPGGAVNAWLGSRGHRAIMLGGYKRYGVGCVVLENRDYWIAIFE